MFRQKPGKMMYVSLLAFKKCEVTGGLCHCEVKFTQKCS